MIIVILLGMAVVIVVGVVAGDLAIKILWPMLEAILQVPLMLFGLFVCGTGVYVLAFKLPYWIFLKLRCAIVFFQGLRKRWR